MGRDQHTRQPATSIPNTSHYQLATAPSVRLASALFGVMTSLLYFFFFFCFVFFFFFSSFLLLILLLEELTGRVWAGEISCFNIPARDMAFN